MKHILSLSLILLATCASAADGLKEGQWEFTTQMDIPGMPAMPQLPPGVQLPPGMQMPSMGPKGITMKRCMTADKAMPQQDQPGVRCEMTQQNQSGSSYTWTAHCTGKNTDYTSKGVATYTGDSMTSEMSNTGTLEGHPANMKIKSTGKYLGACPAR